MTTKAESYSRKEPSRNSNWEWNPTAMMPIVSKHGTKCYMVKSTSKPVINNIYWTNQLIIFLKHICRPVRLALTSIPNGSNIIQTHTAQPCSSLPRHSTNQFSSTLGDPEPSVENVLRDLQTCFKSLVMSPISNPTPAPSEYISQRYFEAP